MYSRIHWLAALIVPLLISLNFQDVNAQSRPTLVGPDHHIVVFKDTVPDPDQVTNELAQRHGLAVSHAYSHALKASLP